MVEGPAMTLNPSFSLETSALLEGVAYAAIRQLMQAQATEREIPPLRDTAEQIVVELGAFGSFEAAPEGDSTRITLRAALPDRLFVLQDSFIDLLQQQMPELAATLRWSGTAKAGSLPPNVYATTVLSITQIGRDFLRVKIQGDDLSAFRSDAIHFRLLLPPVGCTDPQWPQLGENGATIWPKGDKALHRPVYTTRRICHDSNQMEFDIFVHEGGRATNWAQQASPGDQLVIIGPGGGGIPDTRQILIYADETALPAAARILETLPDDSQGQALLLAAGGADCGYPVTAPAGIALRWVDRNTTTDDRPLAAAALAERPDHANHYLWFASEKSETKQVREAFKPAKAKSKADAETSYIAAYWSKS